MRNLLALLGLAVVLFAAIGYYQGWYSFQREGQSLELKVDESKVKSDVKSVLPQKN